MFKTLRNPKTLIALAHDAIIALFSFTFAVALRFETLDLTEVPVANFPAVVGIVFTIQVSCFYFMGLYKGIWRFSSTHDLIRVMKGASLGVLLSIVGVFLFNRLETVPRSSFIIDWLLLVIGLGGGRFLYRIWKDSSLTKGRQHKGASSLKNILIVGSGSAGNQLAKDIFQNPSMGLHVVGFIDDDKSRVNRLLNNIKILGASEDLPRFVNELKIDKVFLAIPSATGNQIREIVNYCKDLNVEFKILPKLSHLLSDKVSLSILRDIKFEDLLGREPIKLDQSFLNEMVEQKVVLVSGAGGSIGSELCRQLTRFSPRKIILLELSEHFLYQLEMEFRDKFSDVDIVSLVADVRSKERVESILKIYNPSLIIHAAAYKHVPMMEKNPIEAVRTNILGTYILSEAAIKYNVEKFVMISTDKAVNPTNIMGASKRIAEMVCRKRHEGQSVTKFITVRFGNVLGSNGSVIPYFQKLIEEGKDIPVTHIDIERYFMSIPEACQLVLQAAAMGEGGEIFVLDMGEPIKIMDLAKEMIKLAGLELGKDIDIKIVGLRPGEKLYEELFSENEKLFKTNHEKVRVAESREIEVHFDELLETLIALPIDTDFEGIIRNVKKILPEFIPDLEKGIVSSNLN